MNYSNGGGGGVEVTYGVRASLFVFCFLFSDKINQIGVLHLKNFHFSLAIFKNGVKRSKNPILHDSRTPIVSAKRMEEGGEKQEKYMRVYEGI